MTYSILLKKDLNSYFLIQDFTVHGTLKKTGEKWTAEFGTDS
jgi:hypothetical protein